MNLSIRQLRAFITVAEHGSFSQAALQLHLTQSALSGLIKELENQLAMRLFDRTTRQLHLTDAGRRLLPSAQRVLNDIHALAVEAQNIHNGHSGQVRFAVSQQLAASVIPDLITRFQQHYPDIRLHLVDCSVEQVLDQVNNADVDFGMGPERTLPPDIESNLLFALPFYVALPADHPLEQQASVSWQDLQQETLITLNGPFTDRLAEALPETVAEHIRHPRYSVNFLSTAIGLTRNDLGLTLCLPYAADMVRRNGLIMRKITGPVIERKFFIYRRKNRSLTPSAEIFCRFLNEETPYLTCSN
ncbi:MAG: LysR family transcriptional regulator [Neisseria sp.]|uniref:LysR family transcriptional regulator n=1 Tax=Neisseria sp. TaxID=192066 RepID=UPI0026DC73E2|nr:LysR family transcriptional regulator [Neisseria sp.]MDO4249702.1 LysR family transcriptional regulator [Neisseria sp.]